MNLCCLAGKEDECLLDSVEETSDYSQWMTTLPKELTIVPITQLAIPGSHDSGAYYLDTNSPVSPDESSFIKFIGKFSFGKKIIVRWSLTQKSTITDQLNKGVRYFDMRVGYLQDKNDFYFVHGIYGYPISKLLEEMAQFLKANPKEIVVVDFNHFYSFTDEIHEKFINNVIFKILKDLLYPGQGKLVNFTLSEIWTQGKQVCARYCYSNVCKKYAEFWCEKSIDSPWFDTDSITNLISKLNDRFDTLQANTFNVFQAILTPQTSSILKHLTSSLEKAFADPADQHIITWLQGLLTESKRGVNIVICDFIKAESVIPHILNLNQLHLNERYHSFKNK